MLRHTNSQHPLFITHNIATGFLTTIALVALLYRIALLILTHTPARLENMYMPMWSYV